MTIKILFLLLLVASLTIEINWIVESIIRQIRNFFAMREYKRNNEKRDRSMLYERLEDNSKFSRSLQSDIWKLEEVVEKLSIELGNKENKKNVKKKKRN